MDKTYSSNIKPTDIIDIIKPELEPIEVKEKISLADKNGKSDLLDFVPLACDNWEKTLVKLRKKNSLNTDFSKDIKTIKEQFITSEYFNEDGSFNENKALAKGNIGNLRNWAQKNTNMILEIADNSKMRLFEKKSQYNDPGESTIQKSKIELAEDDRVLGIPYAQAMAGDRVYVINGKIFTGWALYFSLSSIKSPEDYPKNVDLVYNVPYLHASLLLKAQLGCGTGFDVNYGSESKEVPEERLIRRYLFEKLKLNNQKLIKTGFHLGVYGNAYWALRRDAKGLVDKITILQPERLKIFLDPMTTRIMFYIYLPPIIGGTTIASYPSDGRVNPNILTGVTLSYPTPIVMHPEDVCHFKINDFTEYPFGFSDCKSCIDPATARLDINLLAPILYKKYTKPMIHWRLTTEGIGPNQIEDKKQELVTMLQDMEPGSDPVTTDRWDAKVVSINQGQSAILDLTGDVDTQIFAATGVPETYFKAKGSTDRMIGEQDKTFLARLKVPQELIAEQIEEKLIKPRVYYELQNKKAMREEINGELDVVDEILQTYDSWMASEPKYPKVEWKEIFQANETQSIANAIALLNAQIIDKNRAAMRIGEIPAAQAAQDDKGKVGIDDPLNENAEEAVEGDTVPDNTEENQVVNTPVVNKNPANKSALGTNQENMELLRGGNNVKENSGDNNRNESDVKDPSQLGGSRYQQHKTKGKESDISQKSSGLK